MLKKLFVGVVLVAAVSLIGIWLVFSVYVLRSDALLVRRLAGGLPAARVGNSIVTYGEFLASRDALRAYLGSPAASQEAIPLSPNEIDRKALERLLDRAAIEDLAVERKIVVTREEEQNAFEDLLRSSSSTREEAAKKIQQTFHWTEGQYLNNLFRPQILASRIAATLTTSTNSREQANAFEEMLATRLQRGRQIFFQISLAPLATR